MIMIKVGIIGAAGYVAGELLRILIHHTDTEIVFAHSNSQESKEISEVHTDLVGDLDLKFIKDLSDHPPVDVLFLCGGHGNSKSFLEEHSIPSTTKIIDLSTDFRMKSPRHEFVYGLPELNREDISKTTKLANPGCFATAIQLGLLPLASDRKLGNDIHVHAIT
ncbi:MAG: N-acetyl-gamma-glutamyl-phosphate reductase, partial [Bacteroidia bacterium]|nr:N-acetyl-gamma-glutamyl-phosphate reductase [Bacteroidia bacterium]